MLALQIGFGIWIGGILLTATCWVALTLKDKIEKNRRFGYSWWRGIAY